MGTQSILAMKRNNGSTGAYRLVGATSSQIGANFGTAETVLSATQRWAQSLIQFESTPSIAGTVSTTNGSAAVVGTGTAFTTALVVGAQVLFANQPNVIYTVLSITDNTHMALSANFTGVTNASNTLQVIIQLLAWIRNEIYSYDGSKWTLRFTLNPTLSASKDTAYSGLYYANVAGVTTIIGVYQDTTTGAFRGISTTDGFTWTTTAALANGGNPTNLLAYIVYQNIMYVAGDTTNIGHWSWDPSGTTTTTNSPAGIVGLGHSFCAFKNNLYKIAPDSTGTPGYWLWVLNAGTWTHVVQLPQTGNAAAAAPTGSQPTIFAPGDGFMYAIYLTWTTAGPKWAWLCAKLDVSGLTGTATDISSSVLPPGYAYGTAPTLAQTARWSAVVEGDSSPTSPTVHLFLATTNSGVGWNHFLWNGASTLIGNGGIPDDTGGDVSMAVPDTHEGAGEWIWVPSDFDIRITGTSAVLNGVQINFRAYGPLGTESKSVALFQSTLLQTPATQMTLTTPAVVSGPGATPTLAGGNQLNGVTCDGNTDNPTTYSVVWSSIADGVANNAKVRVTPRVF